MPRLGEEFFATGVTEEQVDLILHEMGHYFESDHLSAGYNDALTKLGARLAFFVASHPAFFAEHRW